MLILGLNAYHGDSSACIVIDGELIAAVEEERFKRIKHWAGFPAEAIAFCINEADLTLDQVDIIAVNTDPKSNFFKKISYTLLNLPSPSLIIDRILNGKEWNGFVRKARFAVLAASNS